MNAPGFTATFTADNIGDPEPVPVLGEASKIVIHEDAGAATTDYLVYVPNKSALPVRVLAGAPYEFTNPACWQPGDTPGYVATIAPSASFAVRGQR